MARWNSTLVVAAVLVLALVPGSGAPAATTAAASSFTVTITLRPKEIVVGQKATLAGTVQPVRRATKVQIQRRKPSGWVTVAERSMDETGAYRHTLSPTKPGTYVYRARMPKVGTIAAASSPRRTLTVIDDTIVEFTIPAGTGATSWNSSDSPVIGQVGKTLRLTNGDSVPHRPHTEPDGPFDHPGTDVGPGQTVDYVLEAPFTGALYCHVHGPESQFWLTVSAAAS